MRQILFAKSRRLKQSMIAKPKPYYLHLTSSNDLITPDTAFRAGFASLALEKKRRAAPFINQARALRIAALNAATPKDLAYIEGIQPALLMASGVANKDSIHLRAEERAAAIRGFISNFLTPAGSDFVEELVRRFLSAHDKALNAAMRSAGNILAQRKLSRAIISALALAGTRYRWLHATTKTWTPMPDDDSDIELHLRGLSWVKGRRRRTVVYNLTVPFLKNNVDLCLFDCGPEKLQKCYGTPASYVALGELKGGIDPAGADEHWKTARTALERIRTVFTRSTLEPHTFFIGAAIAKKMAQEIWADLTEGRLENAANLTIDDQVAAISRWLCSL